MFSWNAHCAPAGNLFHYWCSKYSLKTTDKTTFKWTGGEYQYENYESVHVLLRVQGGQNGWVFINADGYCEQTSFPKWKWQWQNRLMYLVRSYFPSDLSLRQGNVCWQTLGFSGKLSNALPLTLGRDLTMKRLIISSTLISTPSHGLLLLADQADVLNGLVANNRVKRSRRQMRAWAARRLWCTKNMKTYGKLEMWNKEFYWALSKQPHTGLNPSPRAWITAFSRFLSPLMLAAQP